MSQKEISYLPTRFAGKTVVVLNVYHPRNQAAPLALALGINDELLAFIDSKERGLADLGSFYGMFHADLDYKWLNDPSPSVSEASFGNPILVLQGPGCELWLDESYGDESGCQTVSITLSKLRAMHSGDVSPFIQDPTTKVFAYCDRGGSANLMAQLTSGFVVNDD